MMGCSSTKMDHHGIFTCIQRPKVGGGHRSTTINNLEVIEDPNHFRHGKRDTDTPKQVRPELGTKVPKVSKS
jgi:hypothetical protein